MKILLTAQNFNMSNNLNSKVDKTATQWKVRARQDRANRRNTTRAQEFALDLLEFMESHNIKHVELAERMDVSPQQVNKILRAKANLTFETLDKIVVALGATISSPRIEVTEEKLSKTVGTSLQVVRDHHPKDIDENLRTPVVTKKSPLLSPKFENMNEYLAPEKEN